MLSCSDLSQMARARNAVLLGILRAFFVSMWLSTSLPLCILQICHEFTRFSTRMKIKIANFYGGVPVQQNKDLLKKETPNIVVGTPGRIKQVSHCSFCW